MRDEGQRVVLHLEVDAVVRYARDVGDDEQLVGVLEHVDRGGRRPAVIGLRGGRAVAVGADFVHDGLSFRLGFSRP
jgi:hypothetical protein